MFGTAGYKVTEYRKLFFFLLLFENRGVPVVYTRQFNLNSGIKCLSTTRSLFEMGGFCNSLPLVSDMTPPIKPNTSTTVR